MKTIIFKIGFVFLILGLIGVGCKKEQENERQKINITLHDKPLSVIQKYISGNWKLQYSFGGIGGTKYSSNYNTYMNLTSDHVIIKDDLHGVVIDTTVVWKQELIGINETYLMGFPYPGLPAPLYYIVNEIKNDTLIIADYFMSDGYTHYYTKR